MSVKWDTHVLKTENTMSEHRDTTRGLPMFEVPRARNTDPATSHAAARSMWVGAVVHRRKILDALLYGPLTADQLDEAIGWRATTAGRRLGELVKAGHVERLEATDPTRSGRQAARYRLT